MKPPRWLPIVFIALIGIGIALPYAPRPDIDVPFVSPTTHPGAWVITIDDCGPSSSSEACAAVAKIRAAGKFWDGLEARKLKYRHYQKGQKPAYDAACPEIPGLLVVDASGDVLEAQAFPRTLEQLESLVKRETGL